MKTSFNTLICLLALLLATASCKKKITQQDDELYSRHLQAHIKLTIISTPMPDNKAEMNLLLLNDGQDIAQWNIKTIVDSLYRADVIEPLLVVAIHAVQREQIYGVAGQPDFQQRGNRADKYAAFIDKELYAAIKKKAGVRKFKSVAIAGTSLGGLSAFDIAWNNADKIDKVGVFSGAFWWRDKDQQAPGYSDEQNRIMQKTVRSSRKKPRLKYWFYTGAKEETSDRDQDGIIDVVDDTKDLINILKSKNSILATDIQYEESASGTHDYASWKKTMPKFLIWAFGK